MPHLLGTQWTLERCRLVRTCGRLKRTQPLMAMLMVREPPKPGGGRLWGERPLIAAYKDLRATSS